MCGPLSIERRYRASGSCFFYVVVVLRAKTVRTGWNEDLILCTGLPTAIGRWLVVCCLYRSECTSKPASVVVEVFRGTNGCVMLPLVALSDMVFCAGL